LKRLLASDFVDLATELRLRAEVQKQANLDLGGTQVVQELCFMFTSHRVSGFPLNDDLVLNKPGLSLDSAT